MKSNDFDWNKVTHDRETMPWIKSISVISSAAWVEYYGTNGIRDYRSKTKYIQIQNYKGYIIEVYTLCMSF